MIMNKLFAFLATAAALGVASTAAFQIPVSSSSKVLLNKNHHGAATSKLHTVASPVVPAKELTTTDSPDDTPDDFDWFKAWHPLVAVDFLDAEKPHAFKLLGLDVVVWNDAPLDTPNPLFGPRKQRTDKSAKKDTANGSWRVFVDQCPHRKVPLSEGRIEDDGSLLCSYHGWRFNGEGETIDVPQISKTNELEKIKANPKSNCNSFPIQVIDGVLWVWPDSSDDSKIQSALTPIPSLDLGDDIGEDRLWKGTWNFRELPYGHDYFIENVVDPAHVPVSHHNVVGSRYDDQSLKMETNQPLTKQGFSIDVTNHLNTTSTTAFTAPSRVLIKAPFGDDGAAQYLELYSSPSRPGFSNHVGRMVVLKDKSKEMPKLLKQFTLPLPIWVNHIMASAFLHQDALFLHGQERSLSHYGEYRSSTPGANDPYASAILPCSTDKGVLNFRTWMSKFAGGHIPFKGDTTMPAADNEVVFDVWNGHTKHCKQCQGALKNLKRIRKFAFVASALVAAIRPKLLGVIGSTLAAAAMSGVGYALHKLIGLFYRYEFSHADNH